MCGSSQLHHPGMSGIAANGGGSPGTNSPPTSTMKPSNGLPDEKENYPSAVRNNIPPRPVGTFSCNGSDSFLQKLWAVGLRCLQTDRSLTPGLRARFPLPFLGEVYKWKAGVKAATAQHQYGATVVLSISPSLAGFNLVAVRHGNWRFLPRSGKQDPTDEIAKRANCEDAERPMWLPERCVCPVDVPADTKDHEDDLDSTNIGTGAMDVEKGEVSELDEEQPESGDSVLEQVFPLFTSKVH
ncbi:hypothetical protein STEG23_001313 [Scotinomys teguina]